MPNSLGCCLPSKTSPFVTYVAYATVKLCYEDHMALLGFSLAATLKPPRQKRSISLFYLKSRTDFVLAISGQAGFNFQGTIFSGYDCEFIMEESEKRVAAILQRIADEIGVPVQQFSTDTTPLDASECLSLWFSIRSPEGRYRALQALRAIVEDETGMQ